MSRCSELTAWAKRIAADLAQFNVAVTALDQDAAFNSIGALSLLNNSIKNLEAIDDLISTRDAARKAILHLVKG